MIDYETVSKWYPKQMVSFEELLMPQVVQLEAMNKIARGERRIHQRGVTGDGGAVHQETRGKGNAPDSTKIT
jgi:hypothetical protein